MLRFVRIAVPLGILAPLAVVLATCATAPIVKTPPVTPVQTVIENYQSAADAPKALEKLSKTQDVASMSASDQELYGNLLLASKKYDEAETVFRRLADANPQDKEALTALVLLAGIRTGPEAQKNLVDQMVARFPADSDVLNLQGQNALGRGDKTTAQKAWESSLALKENPDALVGLGLLTLQAKKPAQAITYLDRAETFTQDNDLLYSLRSQAQSALGEYPAAERDVTRALQLMPDNPWYFLDRARLGWLKLGKPAQALADAEKALSLDPTLFYAWEYKAEILESQGKAAPAYQAYRQALSLEKNFRFSYPAVAELAFRLQDYRQAAFYAHEAAKDYPGEYAFPAIEALSLKFLNQADDAKTILGNALPRFEKGTTVYELLKYLQGTGSDFALNSALDQEKKENIRVRVQFYQACQYVLEKAYSSARAAFEAASESLLPGIPEIAAARDWLDHGF